MTSESWASNAGIRSTMLGNKGRDTKPELALRSSLHRAGLRFRKDYRLDVGGLRCRPDIAFTRLRVAVFVDGCFWHCCPEHGVSPKRNSEYWGPKLRRNVERDALQTKALIAAGWTVIRVWEHEPIAEALQRVLDAVSPNVSAS
ncbi:very short patch repair endonuclease [Aeromicrobium fastidiosum]|uniref:very short patch repair endonuclease n=1 Tax=Aeromicrobium fastidiosum TaxID=52699 RepID=UPI0027DEBF83|nr:very short patch repair endonuclease [Aeromicrobium fastidiosum]